MKKAVISTGSKQYLVAVGETIEVELLKTEDKTTSFDALLVVDGDAVQVGSPAEAGVRVTAEVVAEDTKADKVRGVRFKAKKRVHKVHGHRQHQTTLKISAIA